MRRLIAVLLVLLLLVPAFADDIEDQLPEDVEEEELPEEPVVDSGPIPVYLVDPDPEPVPYAAGTVGPAGGYYLDVSSSALGSCTIWLPLEVQNGSFSWYNGQLVSLRSSSVSGVVISNGVTYSLRFSSFLQGAQYLRSSGSSSVWTALNVSSVSSGNVEILERSPSYRLDISYLVLIAIILFVGVRLLGYSG